MGRTGSDEERAERVAAPADLAARLAGVTRRQVDYWRSTDLVVPRIARPVGARHEVRLYSFGELIQLRAVAELRQSGVSLQHIRRVVRHLRDHYEVPLRELRFAVRGQEIYFQHPDGSWECDRRPGQLVVSQVLDLEQIRVEIPRKFFEEGERPPRDVGRVERRRGVVGSKPVFAGTRITVATVRRFLESGYDTAAIIAAYPDLTPEDVEAARRIAG